MINSLEKLKDYAELEAFASAQTKAITELSRKNKKQEEEIIHLKKLLEGSVPLIKDKSLSPIIQCDNDQEYICRTEINKLRDISMERELTLEECKKLDIYSKIIKDLMNSPKTIEIKSRNMSDEELLAALNSTSENSNG